MNRLMILLSLGAASIGGGTLFALSQRSQTAQAVPTVTASLAPLHRSQATATQPAATSSTPSVAATSPSQSLKISSCNGSPAHANFREYPNFSPRSILGVVAIGESVRLTGRTAQGPSDRWYEVINLAPLHLSPDAGAQNRTPVNQVGWIASCFMQS